MAENIISEQARNFLLQNIDSIAEWEALLLLRSHFDKPWSAAEAARHLYVDEVAAAILLATLTKRGMVSEVVSSDCRLYHYMPATTELESLITEAADLYRKYLIPVTQIIHSKAGSPIQAFADSFKLRKD